MIQVDLPRLTVTNEQGQSIPYLVDTNWFDSAESVLDADDRPFGEGSFDVDMPQIRPRFDEFTIGLVDPGDGSAVYVLHDTLMALQELIDPFPVTVTDPRGARSSIERLAGKIEFPIEDENGVAQATIPLKATDPKRYGPAVTPAPSTGLPTPGSGIAYPITYPIDYGTPGDPGQVTLTNEGTSSVVPDLVVTGGLEGGFDIVVVGTGEHIRFERFIPLGSAVTVEQSTGRAFLDGDTNDVTRALTYDDVIAIPPKSSIVLQFNAIGTPTGTPTLTVPRLRPAYR